MKKAIICALLLCVFLSACGQAEPQVNLNSSSIATTAPTMPTTRPTYETMTIRVDGQERYELMKAAATDDAALEEFIATERHPWLKERGNIVALLKLLDSIPFFSVENAKHLSIGYERAYEVLYVVYFLSEEAEAHAYRFDYDLNKERNAEYKDNVIQEADSKEFAQIGKEQTITLLKIADTSGSKFAKIRTHYGIEAEGMYIGVTYKNVSTDVSLLKPEEVFAPMKLEKTFDAAVTESFKSSSVK